MILGLARHFQIPHAKASLMDRVAFDAWAAWYDSTEVKSREVPKADGHWDKCYSSTLPRAMFTANWLYQGPIETTDLLREVPYAAFLPHKIRFPLFMWTSASRVGWYLNLKTQAENRAQTMARVKAIMEYLKTRHGSGERILVVTHGFLMQYLGKELARNGFTGQVPLHPAGGIIYPFELNQSRAVD